MLLELHLLSKNTGDGYVLDQSGILRVGIGADVSPRHDKCERRTWRRAEGKVPERLPRLHSSRPTESESGALPRDVGI